MNLRKLDLNLLLVFNQLMIERRVSTVAESLGVSQPAVSNALRRLRQLLGDELFLRTARGMEPTPFAEQLAEPIAYSLDTINNALSQKHVFDPDKGERNFTIGMTDIGEIYLMPRLLAQLQKLAPRVTLSTARHGDIKEEMEKGKVDLAVGLLPALQGGFFRQRLFRQRYVCLLRARHPLANQKKLSLEDFRAAQHLLVIAAQTGHSDLDKLFERKGIVRQVQLAVPHFVAIGHILQASDLIATVPERLAQRLEQPFELRSVPHPVNLPEHSIDLFWHAKLHRDPANQWLRRIVFKLFAE